MPSDRPELDPAVDPALLPPMLAPSRTALVIIDVQEDFASPEGAVARAGADMSGVAPALDKIAALVDIKRRPASQIRGRKWIWAPVVAIANSAGIIPISYFIFGRRPGQSPPGQGTP